MMKPLMDTTSTPSPAHQNILGQKYAYATAALILGISAYVNLLGLEKGALAILFSWLALRRSPPPELQLHRGWAKTALVLGIVQWVMVIAVLVWKGDAIVDILRTLGSGAPPGRP